jgi:heme A synthase
MNRFRRLADLTILATFALVVLGGIVRVSESGLGCGPGGSGTEGWPLCNGEAVPFFHNTEVIIEFSHRVLAAVVTALIVLLAWTAYRQLRGLKWPVRASVAAAVLVLVQAGLGGLTVENTLAEELVAAHLGLAILLLGLLLWISVRARIELAAAGDPERRAVAPEPAPPTPVRGLKPLAAIAAVLLLGAIVAGGYVAGTEKEGVHGERTNIAGAHVACGEQFPGCANQGLLPVGEGRLVDIQLTHRALVYAATVAILALLAVAFARGSRSPLLALAAALLATQFTLGVLNVVLGEHAVLIVAHLVTATLLWAGVVLIALRLAFVPQPAGAGAAVRGSAEPTTAAA